MNREKNLSNIEILVNKKNITEECEVLISLEKIIISKILEMKK